MLLHHLYLHHPGIVGEEAIVYLSQVEHRLYGHYLFVSIHPAMILLTLSSNSYLACLFCCNSYTHCLHGLLKFISLVFALATPMHPRL